MDEFGPVSSLEMVELILSQKKASFDQLIDCARYLRPSGNFELRRQVANRAFRAAVTQDRPRQRYRRELKEAAENVTSSLIAEAKDLDEALERTRDARALLAKGIRYLDQSLSQSVLQKIDDELARLSVCISDSTPNSLVRAGRILRLQMVDRPDLAIQAANLALKTEPRNPAALNNKASALSDIGEYRQAIKIVEFALETRPGNRYSLATYCRALQAVDRADKAFEIADEAINRWPDDEAFARCLLKIHKDKKQFEDFAEILEDLKSRAPRIKKRDQWIDLLAVEIHLDSGDIDLARTTFELIKPIVGSSNQRLAARIRSKLKNSSPQR